MAQFIISCLIIFTLIHEETMTVPSKDADFYWRDYRGTIPLDAIPTGHATYIAQVFLNNGGLVPGTLYPQKRSAVSEGPTGRVEFKTNIKVLCSTEREAFKWEYVNVNQLDPKVLEKCVLGGFEEGSSVYIGKVFHEGEWKVGKVFPPTAILKGLRVWWNNGRGYYADDFQILMVAEEEQNSLNHKPTTFPLPFIF